MVQGHSWYAEDTVRLYGARSFNPVFPAAGPTPLETLNTSMLYRVPLKFVQKNLSKSQRFVTFRNKLVIFR
jgi:hypothetical protein